MSDVNALLVQQGAASHDVRGARIVASDCLATAVGDPDGWVPAARYATAIQAAL